MVQIFIVDTALSSQVMLQGHSECFQEVEHSLHRLNMSGSVCLRITVPNRWKSMTGHTFFSNKALAASASLSSSATSREHCVGQWNQINLDANRVATCTCCHSRLPSMKRSYAELVL